MQIGRIDAYSWFLLGLFGVLMVAATIALSYLVSQFFAIRRGRTQANWDDFFAKCFLFGIVCIFPAPLGMYTLMGVPFWLIRVPVVISAVLLGLLLFRMLKKRFGLV